MSNQIINELELYLINLLKLFAIALIFFNGNLFCQFVSMKKLNRNIDYFQSLNAAFAGIMLGYGFSLIRITDLLSEIVLFSGLFLSGITVLSMLSGLLNLLIKRDGSRIKNSFFILSGLFNTDNKDSSSLNIPLLLSRFTWELPQTLLGYFFVQWINSIGRVGEVQFLAGSTFCLSYRNSSRRQGVSISNFIYVCLLRREVKFEKDPLLLHEYGHHLQSRKWGLFYLFVIGIPSLISAIRAKPLPGGITTHDLQWYEMQANRYAADYLQESFQADWTPFEPPFNSFPRRKPRHLLEK